MGKKIDEIVGMADIVKSLHKAGKIPREIREELLKKYTNKQTPSLSVIYEYINSLSKEDADLRVSLTGNVLNDCDLLLSSFDNLLNKIFNRYSIGYSEKKLSNTDLTYFRLMLRSFGDEAVSSYQKFNKGVKFYYLYYMNDVILPILDELSVDKDVYDKIMKKLEDAVEESEDIDIDKYIARYVG